jgi:hypothetical protein
MKTQIKKIKAYKVFDKNLKCRDFQYEIGKTYKHAGEISLCNAGFHACTKLVDCFNYYKFTPENRVCEVVLSGEIIEGENKCVCSKITIMKEITWNDVLSKVNVGYGNSGYRNSGSGNSGSGNSGSGNSGSGNSGSGNSGDRNSGGWNSGNSNSGNRNSGNRNSGDRNSGNRNSGDWNSGYRNSGYRNSGNWNSGDSNSGYRNSGDWNSGYSNSGNRNSGDRNSGNWNSGNWNSGFFNNTTPEIINVFGKPCKKSDWNNAKKPDFIYNTQLTKWISFSEMTDNEKEEYPNAETCGGYLKKYGYKEAWKIAFENRSENDIALLKALPNFDAEIFEDITGIKI